MKLFDRSVQAATTPGGKRTTYIKQKLIDEGKLDGNDNIMFAGLRSETNYAPSLLSDKRNDPQVFSGDYSAGLYDHMI